jgi:hypothetical protein
MEDAMQAFRAIENKQYADYVFLCGVMWTQYASEDACMELVRAMESKDPDVALLACSLLEKKMASA